MSIIALLLKRNPLKTILQHKQPSCQPSFTFNSSSCIVLCLSGIVVKTIAILFIKTSYSEATSLNMLNPFYFILPEMCWGSLLRQNDSNNNCTLDFVCQRHLTTLQKSIHQLCGFIVKDCNLWSFLHRVGQDLCLKVLYKILRLFTEGTTIYICMYIVVYLTEFARKFWIFKLSLWLVLRKAFINGGFRFCENNEFVGQLERLEYIFWLKIKYADVR